MAKRGSPGSADDAAIVPVQRPNPVVTSGDPPVPANVSQLSLAPDNAAHRARVDAFPLLGSNADEKVEELKTHMVTMHNDFSRALAQVRSKADAHFDAVRVEVRGNMHWPKTKFDGLQVTMRKLVDTDQLDVVIGEARSLIEKGDDRITDGNVRVDALEASIANLQNFVGDITGKLGKFEANVKNFNDKVEAWAESTEAKAVMTKISEDCVKGIVDAEFTRMNNGIAIIEAEFGTMKAKVGALSIEQEQVSLDVAARICDMGKKLESTESQFMTGPIMLLTTRIDSIQQR